MTRPEPVAPPRPGGDLHSRAALPVDDPYRPRFDVVPEFGSWVTVVDTRHGPTTRPLLLPVRRGRRFVPGPSVSLDERTFREVARALVGHTPVDLVEEHDPLDDDRARYVQDVVGAVRRAETEHAASATDPIVRRTAFASLVAAVLVAFPVTAPRPVHDDSVDALPASLRRAVLFMEAHLAEGASVEEIAAEARLSVRGLQAAFRRHLDRTPLEHLRILRVLAAHEELAAADPADGTRIEDVAARWGFSSSGRFAAAYRQEYGVLPSATLRR